VARYGLAPREYVLFVGRLVPENRAHHLVEAFERLSMTKKGVIVGDASYAEAYIAGLKATRDPRVIFTGYLFGDGYRELLSNAYVFVETAGAGGTHPAVVEALALGNCVVVHDTPENLETIGDAALAYDGTHGPEALGEVLADLLRSPERVAKYRVRAARRARERYSWEQVTGEYEALFERLTRRAARNAPSPMVQP
jgi:glycosyltransferase involved in cell wall biosynthesis